MSAARETAKTADHAESGHRQLSYWAGGVLDRERADPAMLARMLAHPNFPAACLQLMRTVLALQHTDPDLLRVLVDMRRVVMAMFVVYLDVRGGITLTSVRDLCREFGLASPGTATSMMFALRMRGFVEAAPVQADNRSRRYVPSAKIRTAMIHNFRVWGTAFAQIEPAALRVLDRFEEPAFFNAYISALVGGLSAMMRRGDTNAVTPFARRNAGMEVLYALATEGQPGDAFPPRQPVPVSAKALAARFKVSRTHVGRVLRDAEALGYVKRNETTITLEEPLRNGLAEFMASYFFGFAACAAFALETCGETA